MLVEESADTLWCWTSPAITYATPSQLANIWWCRDYEPYCHAIQFSHLSCFSLQLCSSVFADIAELLIHGQSTQCTFFSFFPQICDATMLALVAVIKLSYTFFFRFVKYSITISSSSCVIALPEECLSGQLWYLLTQMSLHTSQGYLFLQQWARWHPVTIIQSRRSKKPELTKAKSCNILPKVSAPLPSHAYEFEWHPILNPSKADSLQL